MNTRLLSIAVLAVLLLDITGCGSSYTSSGIIYYRQKNYEKAAEQLQLAVAANPKDYKAQYHLGISLAELGRWPEAAQAFTAAREAMPSKASEVDLQQEHYWANNHNDGVKAMGEKRYEDAIKSFESAIAVWPEKPDSYALLGSSYVQMAAVDTDEAVRTAHLEKGAEQLASAAARNPKDTDTWLELAQTNQRLKKCDAAASAYQSAVDSAPADAADKRFEIYNSMGDMHFICKQYEQAYDTYMKAIELRPEDGRTQYQLGLVRFNQERFGEAATHFGKAAELTEGQDSEIHENSLYNSGLAALKAGDPQRTVQVGNQLVALREDPKFYILRGQAKREIAKSLEGQGKKDEAKRMTEEVLADFAKAESLSGG